MTHIRFSCSLRLFLFTTSFIIANLLGSTLAVVPTFDRSSENVTVIIGSSATLPCFISNLGDHKVTSFTTKPKIKMRPVFDFELNVDIKVAWIKVSNMDIIAIGDYKVTNDDRIKLLHGYVTDWSLSIQPVNEEDAGEYICQVNTEPQMITKINLQVFCKISYRSAKKNNCI
jgi:hypothetical protein